MADEQDFYIDDDGNVKVKYTESQFEPIPAGEYDMIIQNVEVRRGKESGDQYFAFEFRTSDPDGEYDNKVVWENISPKAAWRMTQLIEAVEGPLDAEEGDEVGFNVFDLFGAKITARVGLEEVERGSRKGEMRNNISRFIPLGGELEEEIAPPKKAPRKRAPAKKAAAKKAPAKRTRRSTAKA
jgi:hypothetical protein